MEVSARYDETHSKSAVVKHEIVEVSLEPIHVQCIENKSKNIPSDETLDPLESNEVANRNAVLTLADSKFESLFLKTESEEIIQTIKEETEEFHVELTNSSEIKQKNIEFGKQFLPEFPYLSCKSEVADEFALSKEETPSKHDSIYSIQNETGGDTCLTEQCQKGNNREGHSSIQQQIIIHSCNMCGREFPVQSEFKMHKCIHDQDVVDSHDKDKFVSQNQILINNINSPNGNNIQVVLEGCKIYSDKSYSCDVCCKTFKRKDSLTRHMLIHTGSKPFSCSICGKSFTLRSILINHINTHDNEYPFQCSVCGKSFKRKSILTRHRNFHTGSKPFPCSVCSKSFSQRSNLYTHMNIHADKKPFSCSVCGKSFAQKFQLTEHTNIHSDKKPFSCIVCSKSFKQKSALSRHMMTHNDKKPFSCTVCGKSFIRKSYLTEHLNDHSGYRPFPCSVCGKSFKRKSILTQHEIFHTGSKPFSCSACGKSFSQRSNLYSHMHIHADKPFFCSVCGESFKQKTHLTEHTSIHSNK